MRITHITVERLFGVFDHHIPLNREERITIIYGPNGYGKTFTLSLVNEMFNPGYRDFFRIPFDGITVALDDGSTLGVRKEETDGGESIEFEYSAPGRKRKTMRLEGISGTAGKEPEWLAELRRRMTVCFIHTERLREITDEDWERMTRTILAHAEHGRERVALLREIVNERFNHKRLRIAGDRGIEFATTYGKVLRPEHLSSGERHMLFLLTRLLFEIEPDSLILIDEPELSLHILWQQEFLRDLEKIINLNAFDVLVATHSPQIIHDRWDLAVELRGPAG